MAGACFLSSIYWADFCTCNVFCYLNLPSNPHLQTKITPCPFLRKKIWIRLQINKFHIFCGWICKKFTIRQIHFGHEVITNECFFFLSSPSLYSWLNREKGNDATKMEERKEIETRKLSGDICESQVWHLGNQHSTALHYFSQKEGIKNRIHITCLIFEVSCKNVHLPNWTQKFWASSIHSIAIWYIPKYIFWNHETVCTNSSTQTDSQHFTFLYGLNLIFVHTKHSFIAC